MKQIRKILLFGLIFALVCSVSYASPPAGIGIAKTEVQKQFKAFYPTLASQDLLTTESVYFIDVGQYRPCTQHENLYYINIGRKINLEDKAVAGNNDNHDACYSPPITRPGNNNMNMINKPDKTTKKVVLRKHYLYWQGRANRN